LANDLQPRVTPPFFQLAHVAAVHVCLVGQVLLGETLGVSEAPEISRKDLAQVHAPSQACCCLLTHRFKPTKIAPARNFVARGDSMRLMFTYGLTLASGLVIALGIGWVIGLIWPSGALPITLIISAWWAWTGWKYAVARDRLKASASHPDRGAPV